MATTPEQAAAWADAQVSRHGGRRVEDRGMALAVRTGLQMVQDTGPDTMPMQQYSAEGCADTSDYPRMPRRRPLLTPAGWAWLGYFAALLLSVGALAFLIRR